MPDDISDEKETSKNTDSGILHHYEEENTTYVAEEYLINISQDISEGTSM